MKIDLMKKTAAVLALTLAGSAVNVPVKGSTFLKSSFTAHAEDDICGSFDEETRVLSYVYSVLHNPNASKKLTEMAKAFYVYAYAMKHHHLDR